ncbi:MAG: hypothetical protein ACYSWO_22075, partial [Planctomycetota bacterium]
MIEIKCGLEVSNRRSEKPSEDDFITPPLSAGACLTGCLQVGPGTVARDRFGYTDAISESWKRQMLLNMVKIRYSDAPVFLEVASVINQYALEAELRGTLAWNAFLPLPSQNVTTGGRYADRPTITYQPLTGEKFTRSLMTPIRPDAILSLIQAGWRADMVFRLCTQSINGVYNSVGGKIESRLADPEFHQLTESYRKIQASLATGMRIERSEGKKPASVVFFRKEDIELEIKAEIAALRKLLGLNPDQDEFKVVYGSLPKNDQEIAILSRSMLEILQELGAYIDVPPSHVSEQRVMGKLALEADIAAGLLPLMRVHSGKEKSKEAFVSVRYRDYWYWIDDRDFVSKRVFSFLMFLFSLAETGTPVEAPS